MSDVELAFTPAWRLRELVAAREVSPVEVTEHLLRRIEALNPTLHAYLTVCAEEALAEARAAEGAVLRREALGPLHGVPLSVKDLLPTRGVRTTYGSLAFRDHVPDRDAIAVERVRAAGAVILGKTNTSEFGHSATTENRLGDHGRNPWDPERTAGGSSGGAAAAVAAGLGPLAIGSDGGGSIRVPSAFCGVFGIKPTQGRVPAEGPNGMPLFGQSGPIARTVRDAALLLQVLAGPDRRDPACLRTPPPDFVAALEGGVRGLRVAFSPTLGGYAPTDPQVRAAVAAAANVFARELGCAVEEAAPPMEDPPAVFGPIVLADSYAAQGFLLEGHAEELMPYVRRTLERGREVTGAEYSRALRGLERHRAAVAEFFERFDLLLLPATAVPAFRCGQRPRVVDGQPVSTLWGAFPFTMPFNLTGQPAASVPCGFSDEGLPLGLQVVGRLGEEATVLRAAAAFEAVRPWAQRRPPVA